MKFKSLFAVLFLLIGSMAYSQQLSNTTFVGSVPTLSEGVSVSVYADGSGLLAFRFGNDGAMNLDRSSVYEFLSYMARYDKFVSSVSSGNSGVKFSDFIGGRPFMPNLPYGGKVFVEATTLGSVDTCAFAFRLVNFFKGGWGNDRTYALNTEQVQKLKELINSGMDQDTSIRNKIVELRTLLEAPL